MPFVSDAPTVITNGSFAGREADIALLAVDSVVAGRDHDGDAVQPEPLDGPVERVVPDAVTTR